MNGDQSSSVSDPKITYGIIGGVSGGIIVAAIAVVAIVVFRMKRKKTQPLVEEELEPGFHLECLIY